MTIQSSFSLSNTQPHIFSLPFSFSPLEIELFTSVQYWDKRKAKLQAAAQVKVENEEMGERKSKLERKKETGRLDKDYCFEVGEKEVEEDQDLGWKLSHSSSEDPFSSLSASFSSSASAIAESFSNEYLYAESDRISPESDMFHLESWGEMSYEMVEVDFGEENEGGGDDSFVSGKKYQDERYERVVSLILGQNAAPISCIKAALSRTSSCTRRGTISAARNSFLQNLYQEQSEGLGEDEVHREEESVEEGACQSRSNLEGGRRVSLMVHNFSDNDWLTFGKDKYRKGSGSMKSLTEIDMRGSKEKGRGKAMMEEGFFWMKGQKKEGFMAIRGNTSPIKERKEVEEEEDKAKEKRLMSKSMDVKVGSGKWLPRSLLEKHHKREGLDHNKTEVSNLTTGDLIKEPH